MAQPISDRKTERPVSQGSESSESSEEQGTAYRNAGWGGSSPGNGKGPVVAATPAATGGNLRHVSTLQRSPSNKTGVSGSPPAYASSQVPSARELALRATAKQVREAIEGKKPLKALKAVFKNAQEVRFETPAQPLFHSYEALFGQKWIKQLRIHYLELTISPVPKSLCQQTQMALVTELLNALDSLPDSTKLTMTVDLELPLSPRTALMASMAGMYSRSLQDALVKSNVVARVRVQGYQPEFERLDSLVWDNTILGNNQNIKELLLADCEFDNEGACQLAAALEENTSILKLVISNCSFPEQGCARFAKAISRRSDLSVVGFSPVPGALPALRGSTTGKKSSTAGANATSPGASSTASAALQPAMNTASSSTTTTTATPAVKPANSSASPANVPARTPRAHSSAGHEKDLADAAAEVHAGLKQDDPMAALRAVFSRRVDVRIEVPARIHWQADKAGGMGDGYEALSGYECLSRLKLRNLELRPMPCQAGEDQSCQLDFLAYTLDSLSQLPKKSLASTHLAIVLPNYETAQEVDLAAVRAQDGLFRSLLHDRLTARLDLGSMAPRTEGSIPLCRFFESLRGKTRLVALDLRGANLNLAETVALAKGLRENESIQVLDLTGTVLDAGARNLFDAAVEERDDLTCIS